MSKEREGEPGKEQELPYYQAARFQAEGPAPREYFALQDTIFQSECTLSTYRIILNGLWYVALLGDRPAENLQEKLNRALRHGDPVRDSHAVDLAPAVEGLSYFGSQQLR